MPNLGVPAPNLGIHIPKPWGSVSKSWGPRDGFGIPAPDIEVQGPDLKVPWQDLRVLIQIRVPRLGVSESLDPIAGCKRPRCRGAGPGSGTAAAPLDSWPAEGTDPEKGGLLRRVGGQPGSSRAGVGRGLGADRRTDRQGHAGTRAPQRRRGRRGGGAALRDPSPAGAGAGAGRGPGRRAGSGCSRGLLAGNPGPCACSHLKAQASRARA